MVSVGLEYWNLLEQLINENKIIIDRKRGSVHPMFPQVTYPVDYGYISNTKSMDGSGIDVFAGANGSKGIQGIICTIDMLKNDSEIKVLIGCSNEETDAVLSFLNSGVFMKALYIPRD